MVFLIRDLLSKDQVATARKLLRTGSFLDGSVTAKYSAKIKNNRELQVGEEYVSLVDLVERAFRTNNEVEKAVFPRYITRPIINRYDIGMYYREHTDGAVQGLHTQYGRSMAPYGQNFVRADFSMTLFLDDPQTYDGGELVISEGGDPIGYKLEAGSALLYTTGTTHSVRPVTRGVRNAAIIWIQSMIRNSDSRALLSEARMLHDSLAKTMPESNESFLALDHYNNLLRYLADI